jgi:hypothetical protein
VAFDRSGRTAVLVCACMCSSRVRQVGVCLHSAHCVPRVQACARLCTHARMSVHSRMSVRSFIQADGAGRTSCCTHRTKDIDGGGGPSWPPLAPPTAVSEALLDVADIALMDGGGGALNLAFSARASSSLPFSTHILSCGAQQQKTAAVAPRCHVFRGAPTAAHTPHAHAQLLTHAPCYLQQQSSALGGRAPHLVVVIHCVPCPQVSNFVLLGSILRAFGLRSTSKRLIISLKPQP